MRRTAAPAWRSPAWGHWPRVAGAAFVGIFRRTRDLRPYFSGQNLVLCVIGAPLVIAVCFALAAVAGDPGMAVEATPVVLGGIGAALGLGDLFTAALPYPMVKRAGTPVLVAAPGYAGYRLGGLLTLAGTAVLAANGPDAIRIGVLLPSAAAYGIAFAVIRCAAGRAGCREHAARNVPGSAAHGNVTVTRSHHGHSVRP